MARYDWITDDTRAFMKRGYLTGQSVEDRCAEIVLAYENNLKDMGLPSEVAHYRAGRFEEGLAKGYYSLATPVWVSYGNNRGLPVSCFGSDIQDKMEDILYTSSEVGMLTKMGGGTSANMSNLRPRGTPITDNGEADGAAHFARLLNTMMQVSRQGSRRGYLAAYLDADHGDIDEFMKIGSDSSDLQNITTGINFSDSFMNSALIDQEGKEARTIADFHKARGDMGYPYALFIDNANNQRPQVYKDRDMKIKASNLCVTGDTRIMTSEGYRPIEALSGQTVSCWNGQEWSETTFEQTSEGQKVVDVVLSNGVTIKATPYHKWAVVTQDKWGAANGEVEKRTHELEAGDKLVKFELEPVSHGTKILANAYDRGLFTAEGTVQSNTQDRISLYHGKKTLLTALSGYTSANTDSEGRTNVVYDTGVLGNKYEVPSSEYSVSSRLEWLAGLFDGDGTLTDNKGAQSIQLVSTNRKFLQDLVLLLQELGVYSSVSLMQEAEYRKLPANDGSGELKEFWCKASYRIMIPGSSLNQLLDLDYQGYRVQPYYHTYNRQATRFIQVVDVIDNEEIAPTYCGHEPLRHKLMYEGVLGKQCNEIMLPSSEDESFVCVLSSMNLVKYDEWKGTDAVESLIFFLDTVVHESIVKLQALQEKHGHDFLEKIRRFLTRHRALGMGVLGWHHLLQSKSIAFESQEAARLNNEVFKYLNEESHRASRILATLFGEPELLVGYGMRNTTTMAIAPTKSSSTILGHVSEGIQPELANIYLADLANITVVIKNPYLERALEELGMNTPSVWESIEDNAGSVQHLDIPEALKEVFKTFPEISPVAIIDQAAVRQQYIDQGQSLNLIFHPDVTSGEINHLFYRSWKAGIKGWYYQIGMSAAQALNSSKLNMKECIACSS